MNAVMGYEPAEGEIRYKGTDIYQEYERMKYEIGYVPQEDLLRKNDSVYDTLLNAARMRLPVMEKEEYDRHVEETLHMLGLERLRDALVVKLSGGQRKRLSIAVEYVGNPSLFFLDEPDSGLDGTMARQLWENLRSIADQGKIVMVISHSPDRAFKLFDKIIVLAKNSEEEGRLVYYGSPKDACAFFEVDDLEGIMRRINYTEEGGEGLADFYIDKYETASQAASKT
jgi:ABC-type multidrug transport system ATPase subunit